MQLYTNATISCPGAEHILLSFPKRLYEERTRLKDAIGPGVSRRHPHEQPGWSALGQDVSGGVAAAGTGPAELVGTRNNMPAWGIIQTAPDEFSLYASEHAGFETTRCGGWWYGGMGLRPCMRTAAAAQFVTRPIRFSGDDLVLNYSTTASGSIRVEVQDESVKPVPGFTLEDAPQLFGDALDEAYHWKDGARLSRLKGKAVRLRFVMQDADLYAIRTGQPEP